MIYMFNLFVVRLYQMSFFSVLSDSNSFDLFISFKVKEILMRILNIDHTVIHDRNVNIPYSRPNALPNSDVK